MERDKMNLLYEFHNPYLNRSEYIIEFDLNKEKLPSRSELREIIAKNFNKPPELVIIRKLRASYGGLKGYAEIRIYGDKESLNIESQHILLRHLSKEERSKVIEEMKKKKLEAKRSKEKSKK